MECSVEDPLATEETEFDCVWDRCSLKFSDKDRFHRHVEKHIEGNPFDLWTCKWRNCTHSDRFKHRYMLQRHLRTHTGELPFSCEHCSSMFSTRENLMRHDCRHTGRLPYPCRKCNKRYARTSERLKCEAFHAGKKYLCPLCEKVYSDSGSLRRHKRRDHGVTTMSKKSNADTSDSKREVVKSSVKDDAYIPEQPVFPCATEVNSALPEEAESRDVKMNVQEVIQSVEPWILLPTPSEISSNDVSCADQACQDEMRDDVIGSVYGNVNYVPTSGTVNGSDANEVTFYQYAVTSGSDDGSGNFVDSSSDNAVCRYQNVSIVVPESSIINIELPTNDPTQPSAVTSFPNDANFNTNMPVNLSMVCQNKYEANGEMLTAEYALPPIHTLTLTSFSKYFNDQPLEERDPAEYTGPLIVSIDGALDLTSGHGMPATYGETDGSIRCGCGAIDLSISTEWTPEPGFSFTSLLNSNMPYDPIDLSSAAVPLSSVDDYK